MARCVLRGTSAGGSRARPLTARIAAFTIPDVIYRDLFGTQAAGRTAPTRCLRGTLLPGDLQEPIQRLKRLLARSWILAGVFQGVIA